MTEEDVPFIRAILASPRDMAPRLAYAHWLDERQDTRAEYIRSWVAINDPTTPADAHRHHAEHLLKLHGQINRHWTGFIPWRHSPDEEGSETNGPTGNRRNTDAQLQYGPCAICERRANRLDCVSRIPCVRCGRVLCWECADTGVYGSLPDFQHFVTGGFSVGGCRLGWDSCPFCQRADWMSTHGG